MVVAALVFVVVLEVVDIERIVVVTDGVHQLMLVFYENNQLVVDNRLVITQEELAFLDRQL